MERYKTKYGSSLEFEWVSSTTTLTRYQRWDRLRYENKFRLFVYYYVQTSQDLTQSLKFCY